MNADGDLSPVATTQRHRVAHLDDSTVALLEAGVPANTRRAYAAGRAEWVGFTASRAVDPLPVLADILADYAAHLLTVGSPATRQPHPLTPSTVEQRLSAISTMSVENGYGRPDLRSARLVLRGARRSASRLDRRAAPVTVPVLRALVAQTTSTTTASGDLTLRARRDRAIVLLGFAIGARRSELVALDIGDIHNDAAGLRVGVLRAKSAERKAEVAVPWASDPVLCPVRATVAYRASLAAVGVHHGALFRRITRSDQLLRNSRLSAETVADVVARLCAKTGVQVPDGFAGWSAHSLRRGMATEARRAGADALRIARHGGWRDNSAALAVYLADVDRWADHPLTGVL